MYTIWGGIVFVSGLLCILTSYKGAEWRRRAEERELASSERNKPAPPSGAVAITRRTY